LGQGQETALDRRRLRQRRSPDEYHHPQLDATPAAEAQRFFKAKFGKTLEEFFDDSKYQLMHIEMFPYGIIHAECFGGELDLLLNRRVQVGIFPWRFVDGESSISRAVAFVEDSEYEE